MAEFTESYFFQAEGGIRGGTVTGVQTCALPIFDDERRRILDQARAQAQREIDALRGEVGELKRKAARAGEWVAAPARQAEAEQSPLEMLEEVEAGLAR